MSGSQLSEPGRRGQGTMSATLLVLTLCVIAPAVAQASPPRISDRPVVTGTPQVGATVEAQGAAWDGRPEPTVTWQWVRCDGPGADTRSCREIDGATRTTYAVREADVGKRLRALLTVRNEDGWAWALSASSAEVAAAPPPPAPDPGPEPGPVPGPATPAPTTPAPTVPAGDVRDEQASEPRPMSPAPTVRIRGRLTRSGARITLLTVRAPRGARIMLRCVGRGCPADRWARTSALTRIKRFEGVLPAGTKLVITVSKAGRIGKRTTIVIRRGKAPRRADRCLMPGARKAVACPAA